MNDFWEMRAKTQAEHDAKYPNHYEDEIYTCIDCYNMDIAKQERERILAMKKEIINCVIDYGLTPEKYERICNDIDALIKGASQKDNETVVLLTEGEK